MRLLLPLFLAGVLASAAADLKRITPAGVKPVGPYSPGLMAGDYLYVSGQGARDPAGKLPDNIEAQAKQCFENIRAIVEAAGLSMGHVVYTQAYLADMRNYDAFNKVFAQYFPKDAPARSTIGVFRMPTDTPVEVSAIAVRDTKSRKIVTLPNVLTGPASLAVQTGDRLFMSGIWGRHPDRPGVPADPKSQLNYLVQRSQEILRAAGLEMRNLVYANVYVDRAMPMELIADVLQEVLPSETAVSIVQTNALPSGAHIEISGVAGKNGKRLGKCTGLGSTIYCEGRFGSTADALAALKADLDAARTSMLNVVAANVYINDLDNFEAMNKVYGGSFGPVPPTRTTVQPLANRFGRQNQISLIAVQ